MTDNDVIKALEWLREVMGVCSSDKEYINGNIILDLINRLQAENERLTEENEEVHSNWQKLKKSYDELLDEAKTEIKRKDKILNSYALQYGTVKDQSKRIEEIKSEARIEFAYLITDKASVVQINAFDYAYQIAEEQIENLLKELDGKENENAQG